MYRDELEYTDDELTDLVYKGYGIKIKKMNYLNIGSFYAFIIDIEDNKKLFLKIYPKDKSLVPIQPSIESLNKMGTTLHRFRREFNINNLSYCIKNLAGQYCYETSKLILIIFEYISGNHPSYSPNQLKSDRLANIFYQLHSIPLNKFTYLESENFDIQYATGLMPWITHEIKITNKKYADVMISILNERKEQLINELENLKQWKEEYLKKQIKYVITHGDAHHYNVIQTDIDLWLVDWDGLKIAPIERDLWHYENMPLIDEYNKWNPDYKIDIKLCHFYRLQRFFEDLHYYLNQVLQGKNSTEHQSIEDKDAFLTHWGWKICLPDNRNE